ncbi:MAG: Lrp/AsnC ligand binding domain-containing protein [Candidatus Bathyarchaeota archaeon]|jgi:DNA-binding Lrp family transcriptional regulator
MHRNPADGSINIVQPDGSLEKPLATAFILIKVEEREPQQLLPELQSRLEIKEAYQIQGIYEILTIVQTQTMPAIEELVKDNIEKLEGVTNTLTLIILEPPQNREHTP